MNHLLPRICWAVAGKVGRNGHWSFPNCRGIGHPRPCKLGWEGFSTDGLLTSVTKPSYHTSLEWSHGNMFWTYPHSARKNFFLEVNLAIINRPANQQSMYSQTTRLPCLMGFTSTVAWGGKGRLGPKQWHPAGNEGASTSFPRRSKDVAESDLEAGRLWAEFKVTCFSWGFAKWLFCFLD